MSYANKTLIASVGAAMALGASLPATSAENPFASTELTSGYAFTAQQEGNSGGNKQSDKAKDKAKEKMMEEGKCGEGKCGEAMMSDKAKEKMAEKAKEGKCGEGKCGGA